MGQRTRMGKVGRGTPISRGQYRWLVGQRAAIAAQQKAEAVRDGKLPPDPTDNAGGRARYAARHAAEPPVKYERTGQGTYTGPKTAKPAKAVRLARCIPMRKIGGVWVALAA